MPIFSVVKMRELSIEVPSDLYDWLDDEALFRKRRDGRPRVAKGPIVVEALSRLRRDLERRRKGGTS
jgi:hypothetical protein